eukprot:1116179-Lingulodinium_polyedra.AAC.1
MAGPTTSLSKGWAFIRERIQMEDPTPMQLYLGCIRKRFEGKVDGVGPVVGVEQCPDGYAVKEVWQEEEGCAR